MTTAKEATRRKGGQAAHASDLRIERRKGIVLLTLARPDRRNSLSEAMLRALQAATAEAGADPTVRAVVLAAEGPVFCAGHDLKELTAHRTDADGGRAFTESLMRLCSTVMQAILHCPKPVIAAVQGTASAAGCQLVATCDLAVASERRLVLHTGRQHRAVLLDAHGRVDAQRIAQARHGDAAAGRDAAGPRGRRVRPGEPRGGARPRSR
jgi:1,4-dihydroxy-2-naphthoyl-CoA synthase